MNEVRDDLVVLAAGSEEGVVQSCCKSSSLAKL
jgi:hypothetical protein